MRSIQPAAQNSIINPANRGKKPAQYYSGTPLRLRVENQLGYKMVKWIQRIEFIESEKQVGLGEGSKNEDDEYFDLLPNIRSAYSCVMP
jgi:methionine sulfoxide reductase catalytic subunit